jgi:hypothetical protein
VGKLGSSMVILTRLILLFAQSGTAVRRYTRDTYPTTPSGLVFGYDPQTRSPQNIPPRKLNSRTTRASLYTQIPGTVQIGRKERKNNGQIRMHSVYKSTTGIPFKANIFIILDDE